MDTIIFDLDNTLTHRERTIKSYSHVFSEHFQNVFSFDVNSEWLADQLVKLDEGGYAGHKRRSEEIQKLEIWKKTPTVARLIEHWQTWTPYHPSPMPGLYETLNFLKNKGYVLGIITNGSAAAQSAKIRALNIESYFDSVTISESAGAKKPERGIFEMALKEIGVKENEALFVGDHPINDYKGALEIGIVPVWFRGFHQWPEEMRKPQYIIDHLFSITALITELNNPLQQIR